MSRYFAIIGAMRTGSNLLEHTLGGLGDTICYGEPFNPAFVGGPRKTDVIGWDKVRRDADPLAFLQALTSAEPRLIPGFRIFNGHIPEVLDHILTDPHCARIVLRRDPLESFVSLKIARTTDQWILKKSRRRLDARIHFDADAYAEYCEKLDAHYAHCENTMAAAGQCALQINYTDLSDRAALLRTAKHIGSSGTPPKDVALIRQNPGHLSTKVENYEEMCAALGLTPAEPPAVPMASIGEISLPEKLPLAFVPIPGPPVLPALALMQRMEARFFGRKQLSRGELIDAITGKSLFPLASDSNVLSLNGRELFTMICHPVRRAIGFFAETLFSAQGRGSSLRHHLVNAHPELAQWTEASVIHEGAQLGPAFSTFLAELARSPHRPEDIARHASQVAVLRAYCEVGIVPEVMKLEDFKTAAGLLSKVATADPIPRGQVSSIEALSIAPVLDGAAFLSVDHLRAIEDLWPEDFAGLGYQADLSAVA